MHKKVMLTLVIGLSVCLFFTFLVSVYVFIKFGPVSYQMPAGIQRLETKNSITLTPTSKTAATGILIFPANLVSPSQYEPLGSALVLASSSKVVILKPAFRLSALININQDALTAGINEWAVIGHSAGAGQACKIAGSHKFISKIVVIDGYCRNYINIPVVTIIGSKDRLLFLAPKSATENALIIPNGDHFMPLSQNRYTPQFKQLISKVIDNL